MDDCVDFVINKFVNSKSGRVVGGFVEGEGETRELRFERDDELPGFFVSACYDSEAIEVVASAHDSRSDAEIVDSVVHRLGCGLGPENLSMRLDDLRLVKGRELPLARYENADVKILPSGRSSRYLKLTKGLGRTFAVKGQFDRLNKRDIKKLLDDNLKWIRDAAAKHDRNFNDDIPFVHQDCANAHYIVLLNRTYRLRQLYGQNRDFAVIRGDKLIVGCKSFQKDPYPLHRALTKSLLIPMTRDAAMRFIPYLESVMGLKVAALQVKDMSGRWGSCNKKLRKINLNSRLAQYPTTCMLAVLAHEMCHLSVSGHNDAFYELLGKTIPDWKLFDEILNTGLYPDSRQEKKYSRCHEALDGYVKWRKENPDAIFVPESRR